MGNINVPASNLVRVQGVLEGRFVVEPSYIQYYTSGEVYKIFYRMSADNGSDYPPCLYSRDPSVGPTVIEFSKFGQITSEVYELDQVRHRDPVQGPSYKAYDKNGDLYLCSWHYEGEYLNPALLECGAIDGMGLLLDQDLLEYYVGLGLSL